MTPINPKIIFEQTESLKQFDNFVEEQFLKADFPSLTPEQQTAHTLAILKAIMEHICQSPVDFIDMIDIIDKDSYDGIIKTKIVAPPPVAVKPVVKRTCPNPARHLPDGTYNSKPLDPDYFRKYWHEKLTVHIDCPRCGKSTGKGKIARHFKSAACIKITSELLENAK